jgi:hypothetical protein
VEKREREAVQAGVGYDKITAERSRAVPVGPEFRNLEEGNRRCSSYRGYFVLSAHGLGEGKDLDWIGLEFFAVYIPIPNGISGSPSASRFRIDEIEDVL